jgi:hypothetical protein
MTGGAAASRVAPAAGKPSAASAPRAAAGVTTAAHDDPNGCAAFQAPPQTETNAKKTADAELGIMIGGAAVTRSTARKAVRRVIGILEGQ